MPTSAPPNLTVLSTDPVTPSRDTPNPLQKYVRVRSEPDAKFVMFDFAIGDPSLYVELVLPPQAFKAFCENNQTIPMSAEQMAKNDAEEDKWRYGDVDTLVGHNHEQAFQSH